MITIISVVRQYGHRVPPEVLDEADEGPTLHGVRGHHPQQVPGAEKNGLIRLS